VRIESSCGQSPEVSHRRDTRADSTRRKEKTRTWMSRWSDRQSSIETGSGWFGPRTGERNFPPKIRVIGDSANLAYPCPCILYQYPVQCREMEQLTHQASHLTLSRLGRLVFFYFKYITHRMATTNRTE
jgi:hypothetical protein